MSIEKDESVLDKMYEQVDDIYGYICFEQCRNTVLLDGTFSLKDLKLIVKVMEESKVS